MPELPERTALYRLYDAESDLLYIGISRAPETRFKVHARYQPWWHLVEYVDLTWFADYPLARAAELARQRAERPPFNAMAHMQSRLSWDMPAVRYDAEAEAAAAVAKIRDALHSGSWRPGQRLAPHYVSRILGLPIYLAACALEQLRGEGYLWSLCKTYAVVARVAPRMETSTAP
ncbi:hypothetical protein OG897_13445 [Streptomyces sp. NBC_00237]|uniref:hypothetical protein n=1 Tax=Streptomyces sp. NBC_00237 TaxID=2975687 RepID=UPI00225C15ED|nr:hypothetical protein [Streptomyces sp. NBC_00237]MCX5202448.1 hypothetical protein [Streptomyces sp. NBC_00237]